MATSTTIVESRRSAYFGAFERRYRMYLTQLFFPIVDGSHQPLFTHILDEKAQYLRLREVRRRLELVKAGQAEPDFETDALDQNLDGAQDRYDTLHGQYASELGG